MRNTHTLSLLSLSALSLLSLSPLSLSLTHTHTHTHTHTGVLMLELFKMVEVPVKVRGWYVKKVEEGRNKDIAEKVEYGPVDPSTGLREKVPLVFVVYQLPPDILLPNLASDGELRIGRYLPATASSPAGYSTADISKVTLATGIDALNILRERCADAGGFEQGGTTKDVGPSESHADGVDIERDEHADVDAGEIVVVVTFFTRWFGSFALLQEVFRNIPYTSWTVYPEIEVEGEFAVRFEVQLPWTTLHFRVTTQGCILAKAIQSDGSGKCNGGGGGVKLLNNPMPPSQFLLELRNYGIMVTPTDSHGSLVFVARKTDEIEGDVARGVALVAGGYRLRCAQLNKQLPRTMAAVLLAPAHMPIPTSDSHWTMGPPSWAGTVRNDGVVETPPTQPTGVTAPTVRAGGGGSCCGSGGLAPPLAGTLEDKDASDDAAIAGGGVTQGGACSGEQSGWGEKGMGACFLDGWDTIFFALVDRRDWKCWIISVAAALLSRQSAQSSRRLLRR
jgi:hypothetical protein